LTNIYSYITIFLSPDLTCHLPAAAAALRHLHSFPTRRSSDLPEIQRRSMEIMEKAICLADDLGIRVIQLAGYDVYYEKESPQTRDRKSTRLNSSHVSISYAVFCLKKKIHLQPEQHLPPLPTMT